MWMDPAMMVPGGNPVTETPGLLTATFPVTVVGPALVTVELPKTVTFPAAPSGTRLAPAGWKMASRPKTISPATSAGLDLRACFFSAEWIRTQQMQHDGYCACQNKYVFFGAETTERRALRSRRERQCVKRSSE